MQVRISKPARSAMQSADGKDNWLLEFVKKPNSRFKESLMGRTSSGDMAGEVRLFFQYWKLQLILQKRSTIRMR